MLSQNVVTNDNRGDCLLNNQVVSLSVPTNGWVPVPGSNDVTKKTTCLALSNENPNPYSWRYSGTKSECLALKGSCSDSQYTTQS
eukprot:COSAG05_NODE_15008_length_380_cov_1.989324_1_plen_84_part_10